MVKKKGGGGGRKKGSSVIPKRRKTPACADPRGHASGSLPLGPPRAAGTPEPRGADTALPSPLLTAAAAARPAGRGGGRDRGRGMPIHPLIPSAPHAHGPGPAGGREAGREAGRAPSAGRRGAQSGAGSAARSGARSGSCLHSTLVLRPEQAERGWKEGEREATLTLESPPPRRKLIHG